MALHLYPSPKDALCLVWLNLPNCSGEEEENVKSLHDDNDDGQRTNCDQKCSLEPLAKVR